MTIESTTKIDIPVVDPHPTKTKLLTFFSIAYLILLKCAGYVFTLVARKIHGGLVAPICHLWARYYWRVALVEEGVIMPQSTLGFIISVFLAFAQIKSQNQSGFPFTTHLHLVKVSITSALMYGLACAIELVVSAVGLGRNSVFAISARWGKIGCLCILVKSLLCLLYL